MHNTHLDDFEELLGPIDPPDRELVEELHCIECVLCVKGQGGSAVRISKLCTTIRQ